MSSRMRDAAAGAAGTLIVLVAAAGGMVFGGRFGSPEQLPRVSAVTSQSDGSFAVCTVPLDIGVEGFFMLDFETGDLSGGVLNPSTAQFGVAYKHNVLKDLGFKAGQAKNPKFLLVSGVAEPRRGAMTLASSVLYVTDSSTGTTAAYGIPWNAQQPQMMAPLALLDIARPRGGGAKAK